jgi:dynein heavy chain, axonemal
VTTIKHKCEEDARRIALEKSTCEADLAKAQPFVDQADAAISSIKPAHIQVRFCTTLIHSTAQL